MSANSQQIRNQKRRQPREQRTSKPIQRTGGVKVGRKPGSNVDELANALDTSRLMEIPSGDRFSGSLVGQWSTSCDQRSDLPQNIEVRPSRNDLHLLEFHDIFQLDAHFPSLTEELGVQEMPYRPIISESVLLFSKLRGEKTV